MAEQGSDERLTTALLTMDVVDELRHRDAELKALSENGIDDAGLKQRLLEIYRSQGIEVPDAVLDAGIAAQRDQRYVYTAPRGLAAWLARGWIARRVVARRAAIAGALVIAIAFSVQSYLGFKENQAGRAVAQLNALVQTSEGRIPAVRDRYLKARAGLMTVLEQANAIPHADRLQALRTDAAAAGRTVDQVANQALRELATRRP